MINSIKDKLLSGGKRTKKSRLKRDINSVPFTSGDKPAEKDDHISIPDSSTGGLGNIRIISEPNRDQHMQSDEEFLRELEKEMEAEERLEAQLAEELDKRITHQARRLAQLKAEPEPEGYDEEELVLGEEVEPEEDNMAFPFHEEEVAKEQKQYKQETKASEKTLEQSRLADRKRRKMLMLIAITFSAIWLGLAIGYYARSYSEWGLIFSTPPHIVGIFLAGLLAPIVLCWYLLGLFRPRRRENRENIAYNHDFQPHDFPSRENLYLFHKDIERFCVQGAELAAYSKAMAQTIPDARERLKEDVRMFLEFSDKTAESVNTLTTLLAERSERFMEVINEIEERTTSLNAEMHEGIKETYEEAKELSEQIGGIATDIRHIQGASQELHVDIKAANKELSSEADRIADVSLKASKVIQQASGSFALQSGALIKAMDEVKDYSQGLDQNISAAAASGGRSFREEMRAPAQIPPVERRKAFSVPLPTSVPNPMTSPNNMPVNANSGSQYSIDGLHAISIDLTRSVDGQVRESIWELYQNGDREAFTQYLLSVEDKVLNAKTFKIYKNNADFRGYVSRYIQQFETLYEELYEEADRNDRGALFPSLILNSNLGRLYKILCRLSGHPAL